MDESLRGVEGVPVPVWLGLPVAVLVWEVVRGVVGEQVRVELGVGGLPVAGQEAGLDL